MEAQMTKEAAKCMDCGPDKLSGVWCDPCWERLKAKVLAKFKESKLSSRQKSRNAKMIVKALGRAVKCEL